MKRDKFCREIKPGDIIKVFHFTAARRRKIYMYKLVVEFDARGYRPDGTDEWQTYLYAVDVESIYSRGGSLTAAHRCLLEQIGECEIVAGGTVRGNDLWWERKRHG